MILNSFLRRLLRLDEAGLFARKPLRVLLQQGYRCQQQGDHQRARELFERAVRLEPANGDANYLLGALLGKRGELEEAQFHLRQAIAANPEFAGSHAALANVYLLQDRTAAAAASYQQSIRLAPDDPSSHSNLGLIYYSEGKFDLARRHFARAYELQPERPGALKELTSAWIGLGEFEVAHSFLQELLRERADDFETLRSLGFLLHKMHRPHEAGEALEKALKRNGSHAQMLQEYGMVLQDLGRIDEAIKCYDLALSLNPDFVLARWHRSLAYLLLHDFERGWPDYELRKISADQPQRLQFRPQWGGEPLTGRRMLVYSEQGLGDEIMFASCLPEVVATCVHCVIECSPKLERVFRRSFPGSTVYAASPSREFPQSVCDAGLELQMAMGSLPRYLRRRVADFPRHSGYLHADQDRTLWWQRRLAELGPQLKVGISWMGGTTISRRQIRSLPLTAWLPILRTPRASFVNLQYGDSSAELAELQMAGVTVHDWRAALEDYDETAALVSALDLVISVCTAVVHLGGALGRPVWVLAPFSPEWRYGFEGDTMPWYPSVRIFRQTEYGEWSPVIEKAARSLADLAESHSHGGL